jgi:predicted DNA binding CopG/RHH family protein
MATPKRKRVRPVENALKDDVVRMRIPAHQKKALMERAARDGLELSAWLRQLALRAAGLVPSSGARDQ